jgi:maltose O-acetyltransferase
MHLKCLTNGQLIIENQKKFVNNVWISGSVTIVPGVTLGDITIIGAVSVVTKDIPANVIVAGVPCRVIRTITEKDKIGLKTTVNNKEK